MPDLLRPLLSLTADMEGILVYMIPIVAIVGGITAGIVRSMMKHQQEMARLMREQPQAVAAATAEVDALRREVLELRDRVNTLAIHSDTAVPVVTPPAIPTNIEQRLNS